MEPKEVAKSYDTIAERWDSEEFPRDNGMAQHARALAFVKHRRHALDLGCGSSGRILDFLISNGFESEALDLSPEMLDRARRRHPEVRFYLADICEWDFPRQYDFISAWDSIWHIPLDRQELVLEKVLSGLAPEGVLICTTGGVDTPEEIRNSAMGPPMYHSALGLPGVLEVLARAGCICRHLEYDQLPERHVYLIAQKRAAAG